MTNNTSKQTSDITDITSVALSYVLKIQKQIFLVAILYILLMLLYDAIKYPRTFTDIVENYSIMAILAVVAWFGTRLVYYIQIKNKNCGILCLNIFILIGLTFFSIGSVFVGVQYWIEGDEYSYINILTPILVLSIIRVQALRVRIEEYEKLPPERKQVLRKERANMANNRISGVLSLISKWTWLFAIGVIAYFIVLVVYDLTVFSRDFSEVVITYIGIIIIVLFLGASWFGVKFFLAKQLSGKEGSSGIFINGLNITMLILFGILSVVMGVTYFIEGFTVASFIAPIVFLALTRLQSFEGKRKNDLPVE